MKYIPLSTVTVADFYKQFYERLALDTKGGKTVMFRLSKTDCFIYTKKSEYL